MEGPHLQSKTLKIRAKLSDLMLLKHSEPNNIKSRQCFKHVKSVFSLNAMTKLFNFWHSIEECKKILIISVIFHAVRLCQLWVISVVSLSCTHVIFPLPSQCLITWLLLLLASAMKARMKPCSMPPCQWGCYGARSPFSVNSFYSLYTPNSE